MEREQAAAHAEKRLPLLEDEPVLHPALSGLLVEIDGRLHLPVCFSDYGSRGVYGMALTGSGYLHPVEKTLGQLRCSCRDAHANHVRNVLGPPHRTTASGLLEFLDRGDRGVQT